MGQINNIPPQEETPTQPANGNARFDVTPEQIRWATIGLFLTGVLWFVLSFSILLSRFKNYSYLYLSFLVLLPIALLSFHGWSVLVLSFKKRRAAAFNIWRAIYTHFIFGMGTFNLETLSTRSSQWSSWLMGTVPLILILFWLPTFLAGGPSPKGTIASWIAVVTYLLNFSFLWLRRITRLPSANHVLIQTIFTIAGFILALLTYLGIGPSNGAPTPTATIQVTSVFTASVAPPTIIPATFTPTATFISTGIPSPSSTAVPTATPTPTATVLLTPTPIIVNAPYLDNIRKGPHFLHPFIFPACLEGTQTPDKTVILIRRDSTSTWFLVRMKQAEKCEGWVHINWLEPGSIDLSGIPTASTTPTNPPAPTQDERPRPTFDPHSSNP